MYERRVLDRLLVYFHAEEERERSGRGVEHEKQEQTLFKRSPAGFDKLLFI